MTIYVVYMSVLLSKYKVCLYCTFHRYKITECFTSIKNGLLKKNKMNSETKSSTGLTAKIHSNNRPVQQHVSSSKCGFLLNMAKPRTYHIWLVETGKVKVSRGPKRGWDLGWVNCSSVCYHTLFKAPNSLEPALQVWKGLCATAQNPRADLDDQNKQWLYTIQDTMSVVVAVVVAESGGICFFNQHWAIYGRLGSFYLLEK